MLDSLCCLRESTNTRGFALIFTTDIHNTRNAFQAQTERAGQTGSGREREREGGECGSVRGQPAKAITKYVCVSLKI